MRKWLELVGSLLGLLAKFGRFGNYHFLFERNLQEDDDCFVHEHKQH